MELSANVGRFYINGEWVEPSTDDTLEVINPATEAPITSIAMGTPTDVRSTVFCASSVRWLLTNVNRISCRSFKPYYSAFGCPLRRPRKLDFR